eukprot:CAMPEP_0195141040 /NCGR_PEP_ID=MMETSP0448-20130528/162250_1 /TAXON_ID=66468 /ORGANISM="Heterocapsa triquestra, Strain CCMP 448" /LENGTH=73 /DNA_ID=CAMNT_0040179419 /DNA_START=26 /DNA_END=243 /DNA_ORIENTATION=-
MESPLCSLGALEFCIEAAKGFNYEPKRPSPLAERCEELGGCELQRLAQCPVVIGRFWRPEPPPLPPLRITLGT